ncbi:hypothetical protein [Rhodococcus ruber]|uniref:hypothetical protein n=1 Tax=Rhodococcus ruber TaxID=1830 RepID=UPI001F2295ED|nr:hypothetical protein [Rhodococcus ruber]
MVAGVGGDGGDAHVDAVVADDRAGVGDPAGGEGGQCGGDGGIRGDVEKRVTFDAGLCGFGRLLVDAFAQAEPADDGEDEDECHGDGNDRALAHTSGAARSAMSTHVFPACRRVCPPSFPESSDRL